MVKFVYHTAALGPISLEFDKTLITVGSAPDNDLVLPHPSVRPHHCQVELREDSAVLHAPADGSSASASPTECPVGGTLLIGEVVLEVQHSTSKTVAVPHESLRPAADLADDPTGKPFFCEHCRKYFTLESLTRIGLEGGRKHVLCPRCSRPVVLAAKAEPVPAGFFGHLKRGLAGLGRRFRRDRG